MRREILCIDRSACATPPPALRWRVKYSDEIRWPLPPSPLSPSLPQEPEFRVPRNIRVYRETCYTYISRPFYPYFRFFLDGLWIFVRSNRFFFYILIIF